MFSERIEYQTQHVLVSSPFIREISGIMIPVIAKVLPDEITTKDSKVVTSYSRVCSS